MDRRKARRTRVLFLLWLIVAVLYFNLAASFVRASMNDKEFGQYLQFAVQIVTEQRRTNLELKQLVVAKAREMEIPLDPARLNIKGEGADRRLSLSYNVLIQAPFVRRALFNREFVHEMTYKVPR
jgi:hypothetical protein